MCLGLLNLDQACSAFRVSIMKPSWQSGHQPNGPSDLVVAQVNLLITFTNLARKKAAKEQIAQLPQWPNIVRPPRS